MVAQQNSFVYLMTDAAMMVDPVVSLTIVNMAQIVLIAVID